jgi:hypothetical protein
MLPSPIEGFHRLARDPFIRYSLANQKPTAPGLRAIRKLAKIPGTPAISMYEFPTNRDIANTSANALSTLKNVCRVGPSSEAGSDEYFCPCRD